LILLLLIIGIFSLNSSPAPVKSKNESGDFSIWIVDDSKTKFNEFITHFKENNKSASLVNINVQTFPNFDDYQSALNSSIIKGETPDMFVLNNNEVSLYEDIIL
jgi:maltose-binding protein MalE